jgi:hypothetical protein
MSSSFTNDGPSRAKNLLALCAFAAWCTNCDLPRGDHGMPDTGVDGVDRKAILRLLAPPDVRRIGAVIPITVEATFPAQAQPGEHYCVRLAGAPGSLVFPFGDRCQSSSTLPNATAVAGGEGVAGAGAVSDRGASGAANHNADSALHVTQSCIAATATTKVEDKSQVTGTLHAAYFASEADTTATLFGVLYDNASCTGEPVTSTALLLDLRDSSQSGQAEGGAGGSAATGGDNGMSGSASSEVGGTNSAGSSGMDAGGSGGAGPSGAGAAGEVTAGASGTEGS